MYRLGSFIASLTLLLATAVAEAGAFPRAGAPDIENGKATPFEGTWSMGLPDDENAITTTQFVGCDLPIRIDAADDTHIDYLSPRNTEVERTMKLRAFMDRTVWLPVSGGPSYIAVWIDTDSFYLYDVGEMGRAEWDWPYIYRRCA